MTFELLRTLDTGFVYFTVFGPILNYLPQYVLMARNRSIGSFSRLVCYILLSASLLRIIFWFGEAYLTSLFLQSLVMLAVQSVLLKKCFDIEAGADKDDSVKQQPVERLNDVLSKFLTAFIVYLFVFEFYKSDTLTAVTGGLSALCEACLPLPQFVNNARNKSVESVR